MNDKVGGANIMKFTGLIPKVDNPVRLPAYSRFDNGHWKFPEQMGSGVGFIYIIRDHVLHRNYLGKKLFRGFGVQNKGVESNWRKYQSSSKTLADHFKERPKSEFEFICIEMYQSKGTLAYAETWSLCHVEAPTKEDWYNTLVEKVSWPVREPISKRHRERLERAAAWDDFKE